MEIDLIVIRTNQPNKLGEFYNLLEIEFDCHRHGKELVIIQLKLEKWFSKFTH
jgi:hypothetical protein